MFDSRQSKVTLGYWDFRHDYFIFKRLQYAFFLTIFLLRLVEYLVTAKNSSTEKKIEWNNEEC